MILVHLESVHLSGYFLGSETSNIVRLSWSHDFLANALPTVHCRPHMKTAIAAWSTRQFFNIPYSLDALSQILTCPFSTEFYDMTCVTLVVDTSV